MNNTLILPFLFSSLLFPLLFFFSFATSFSFLIYSFTGIPGMVYAEAVKRKWPTAGFACARANNYKCHPCDIVKIIGNTLLLLPSYPPPLSLFIPCSLLPALCSLLPPYSLPTPSLLLILSLPLTLCIPSPFRFLSRNVISHTMVTAPAFSLSSILSFPYLLDSLGLLSFYFFIVFLVMLI